MVTDWISNKLKSKWNTTARRSTTGSARFKLKSTNTTRDAARIDAALLQCSAGEYALATGDAAAYRLGILQNCYGEGSRRVLCDAGLRRGMRVADLGCGVGMMTDWLAECVGTEGHVVGVDYSAAQIAQATERLEASGKTNVSFVTASATETSLPAASCDLVYCRFLLLHLQQPGRALWEMMRILKPGGILVCEDGDLCSATSEPQSALGAFADLFGRLGPKRGVNYRLGRRLFQMIVASGFECAEITFNQPVHARGETKRLLELTVEEAGPAFVESGLLTAEELAWTLAEMRRANEDETILAVMPRMAQVWAKKKAINDQR